MSQEDIEWLARRAALANLKLRQARLLFESLYVADALALESGNVAGAIRRSGLAKKANGVNRVLERATADVIGEDSDGLV